MQVLVKGSQTFVTENNCVTVRWGGEQLEVKDQAVELSNSIRLNKVMTLSSVWGNLKNTMRDKWLKSTYRLYLMFGDGMVGKTCEVSEDTYTSN